MLAEELTIEDVKEAKLTDYAYDISKISCCPPSDAVNRNVTVWRWTANPITNSCFYPEAKINPTRFIDESDSHKNCISWALSFFDSKKSAEDRMEKICKQSKKFKAKKGGYVSSGNIKETDGVITSPDRGGHMSFFPYKSFSWSAGFSVVGPI